MYDNIFFTILGPLNLIMMLFHRFEVNFTYKILEFSTDSDMMSVIRKSQLYGPQACIRSGGNSVGACMPWTELDHWEGGRWDHWLMRRGVRHPISYIINFKKL